jgi:hypothetical protein
MLNAIKKLLRISCDSPMQRWSQEKLSGIKQYLECKPSIEWAPEDHYLAVEYLVQRYLPADDTRTESEYQAALEKLKRKIDWNIDNPDAPKDTPVSDPDFAKWMEEMFKS